MKCKKCSAENPQGTRFCGQCGAPLRSKNEKADSPTRTMIATRQDLSIGSTLAGRYHIIEELGEGGMGKVFKAVDKKIDEKVAVKVLKPEVAADTNTMARFRNELKLTRKISHRHICRLYDISEDKGLQYISMEYVSGEDLKSLVRRIGKFTVGKAVFIARQTAEGLSEAHRMGVVHRDLKPQNVMIDREGNAKIMDFGIARSVRGKGLTEEGTIVGTPEYMAPEQVEGKKSDHRSDIYSLGIIMFEMLTGRVPFEGDTPLSVAVKQKTERPSDPRKLNVQIPEDVSRIILKCLQKDPAKRYQSTDQLLTELKAVEKKIPETDRIRAESRTPLTREVTVKFKLNRVIFPAAAFIFLAVLGFIAWSLFSPGSVAYPENGKPSFAVMHFENNTGDTNLEHWRKALSDLLIADLSQSKFLNVLSPERLYDLMDEMNLLDIPSYSSRVLQDLAERAGVKYILVGKMTKAGETLRLNTTLQDAETGEVLGRQQVEGEREASLFTMVDELTRLVKEDFQLTEKEIAADFDQAVEQITTASTEAFNYYREGMKYQNQGDYSKSIPLMELAVAVDPDFGMAYRTLSAAYSNLGLNSEASEKLKKAFELRDRVSERERHYIQADFFRQAEGDSEKAIQAYKKLLQLYPDDRIGNNNLGILYIRREEWDKAIERLSVNMRNRTESYASYTNLSSAYFSKGMPDKALDVLQFYLDEIGENPHIRDNRAWIYIREGKLDEALSEADQIGPGELEMVPAIRGAVYQVRGELDKAEVEYLKLMESKQPQFHNTGRKYLTNLYLLQGKFEEAVRQCEQGKEMSEVLDAADWHGAWLQNEAFVHLHSGKPDKAIRASRELIPLSEKIGSLDFKQAAYLIRGLAYIEKNDLESARENAAGILDLVKPSSNPKLVRMHDLLYGKILIREGNYSAAIEKLKQGASLLSYKNGLSGLFFTAMADAFNASGDVGTAIRHYKKIAGDPAVKLNDGYVYADSLYRLAKAQEKNGQSAEAEASYRRFLELWADADSETPQVIDARRRLSAL
jgi:serine/threonine protein kinase/Flp pilus assembly protein TadD